MSSAPNYIDIDSTYRDRNLNPIPSQFTVHLNRLGDNKFDSIASISNEVPIYPPQNPIGLSQLQLQPIAFYRETLQAPLDTIVERTYLPYIFSVEGSTTVFRLDELPIASTDASTTSIQPSTEFERNTIPLGQADNFYVGDYLEIVSNTGESEFRQITGFNYDGTEQVLQSGEIVAYTFTDGTPIIELELQPSSDLPPSNVDRFYQGKTIEFANGDDRLITNYYINDGGKPIIVLESPLSSIPTMRSTILIKTPKSWIVEVESPFTTAIPSYPAYRTPLPDSKSIYEKVVIVGSTDQILSMASVRHANDTIGIVYQTVDQLLYVGSTDATGLTWGTPITIEALTGSDVYTNSFLPALIHSIDITLIDGNPAIAYTQYSTTTSLDHTLWYRRASTATGTAWNAAVEVFDGLNSSVPNNVRIIPRPEVDGANEGYPAIAATDSTDAIYVYVGSPGTFDSPTFTAENTSRTGFVINMATFVNATAGDWTAGTDLETIGVFYKNESDGKPRFVYSQGGSVTGFFWLEDSFGPFVDRFFADFEIELYGGISSVDLSIDAASTTNTGSVLSFIFKKASSNEIYVRTQIIDVFGGAVKFDIVSAGPTATQLLSDDSSVTIPVELLSPLQDSLTHEAVYILNDDIRIQEYNPISTSIGTSNTFDTTSNISTFSVLPNSDDDATMVFYEGLNSTLEALVPTGANVTAGVQYRIRESTPTIQGFGGTSSAIVGGTTNTIVLPSTFTSSEDDFYNGSYIWVYNQNVFNVPSSYQAFNDYRLITDYDGATRTATVCPEFSANLTDVGITGGNTLNWEILSFTGDSYYPLVYSGSTVSTTQMVCYEISLVSLSLPNVTLSTGNGNRIAFYPYVYVEFSNQTAHHKHLLYSNNPHSTNALFKVPITNIVDPTRSTFVKLSGRGMVHTIQFKPNDNFQFSVFLPNGELFETLITDTLPPFSPDPDIQVSATFKIKRVAPTSS